MHFDYVIQRRKGRAWAVLIVLVVIGILIATFVLLSPKFQGPLDLDELYGVLD